MLPVWAFVNLLLSVVGVIFAIVVIAGVLLQLSMRQLLLARLLLQFAIVVIAGVLLQQKKQQKNNKFQDTTTQSSKHEKQQKQRKIWLVTALALGVAGIIVFLFTEDMSRKMVMVDNWTIVNAVIFIGEIIAITLIFKRKKDTAVQEETKSS